MESLAGRAYLVTGGGTGIGAATALHLARLGASVTVIGRGDLAGLLLSDRAAYVTGTVLTADGGQSLGAQIYGPPVNATAVTR
ncbi:hypothetical protein E1264_07635 [Actinomadura sp. KC216]|uniref:hypothetical protein n=1 Tax=Actinomadura sp. KC216 TaxID=2530370 RepID=UPI001050356E|nr:hypothetical protein [Actinomadura sp. KC216]TDB89648.1 hypothetical protein E1264_07635 [Actinomadura sp. KC216]